MVDTASLVCFVDKVVDEGLVARFQFGQCVQNLRFPSSTCCLAIVDSGWNFLVRFLASKFVIK